MRYFEFKKLVRDEIVYHILKNGDLPKYKYLDEREFLDAVKCKIVEEALELQAAKKNDEILVEVSDIFELLDELMRMMKFEKKDIRQIQKERKQKNGGYRKRIYIENVCCIKNSKWEKYYLKNKMKYPEIVMAD